jgi:D-glycero-D-manno-heptose 1,7-bisphosphate phosphatase
MFRYIRGAPGRKRRPALFLDRDGVLNRRNIDGYVIQPNDFEPLDLVVEAAAEAQARGAALVVVTNQGCVGKGRGTESQVMAIHALVLDALSTRGIVLDAIYTCPHHPLAPDPMQRNCECRKPMPGLILAAAQDLDLDLTSSILIGDQPSDIAAARAAGLAENRTLLVGGADETDPCVFVRSVWGSFGGQEIQITTGKDFRARDARGVWPDCGSTSQ